MTSSRPLRSCVLPAPMVYSRGLSDTANLFAALLATGLCLLIIAPAGWDLMRDPDAGSQLSKGFAILHGRHPFLDIPSSVYGPAIFYLSALAQWLGGQRLISEIVLIFAGYLVAYGLLFWTVLRRVGQPLVYWAFVVACLSTLPAFHKYHVVLAPAIYLACLHVAASGRSAAMAGAWLGAGSAVAGLFRLDFGAYCLITSLVFLWLEFRPGAAGGFGRAAGALGGMGAIIAGPWAVFLIVDPGPVESLARFLDTTVGVYSGLATPLPELDLTAPASRGNALIVSYWSVKLIPWVTFALAAWHFARTRGTATPGASEERNLYIAAGSVAAALFFLQASHRIDFSHMQQVIPPIALIASIGVAAAWTQSYRGFFGILLVLVFCAVGATATSSRLLEAPRPSALRIQEVVQSWQQSKSEIVAQALQRRPEGGLPYAIRRARDLTEPDDHVLFLPYAAQTYYFSERLFETPYGWLNPGRFHSSGSEQAFIDAMRRTVLIVDNPRFSFDRRSDRNMRGYAPRLSRHIYTRYGIFDVAEHHVLLSSDPTILKARGRYRYGLARLPRSSEQAGHPPGHEKRPSPLVSTVNTLPVESVGASYPVPRDGGLLLGLEQHTPVEREPSCAMLAPETGGGPYVVTDGGGTPTRWSAIGPYDLIDTRGVIAGRYHLLRVPLSRCGTQAGDPEALLSVRDWAGVDIELGANLAPVDAQFSFAGEGGE